MEGKKTLFLHRFPIVCVERGFLFGVASSLALAYFKKYGHLLQDQN